VLLITEKYLIMENKKRLVGVTEIAKEVFQFGTPELGLFNLGSKKALDEFFKRKGWDYYITKQGINKNKL